MAVFRFWWRTIVVRFQIGKQTARAGDVHLVCQKHIGSIVPMPSHLASRAAWQFECSRTRKFKEFGA